MNDEQIKHALPTGTDIFKEVRVGGYYYVDKTMMIADFLQLKNKVTLITRLRRFGKTLNMTSGMYNIKSNREFGDGRSDVMMKSLYPNERPHVIIEFKRGKDLPKAADEALEQIITNRYYVELVGKVLCIGIAHNQKKCELVYKEIEVDEYGEFKISPKI